MEEPRDMEDQLDALMERLKAAEGRLYEALAVNEELERRFDLVLELANKRIEEANQGTDILLSFIEHYLLLEHPLISQYSPGTTPKDVIAFKTVRGALKRIVPLNETQVSAAGRK